MHYALRQISMTIVPIEGTLYSLPKGKWIKVKFLNGFAIVSIDVETRESHLIGIQGDAVAQNPARGRDAERYPW